MQGLEHALGAKGQVGGVPYPSETPVIGLPEHPAHRAQAVGVAVHGTVQPARVEADGPRLRTRGRLPAQGLSRLVVTRTGVQIHFALNLLCAIVAPARPRAERG